MNLGIFPEMGFVSQTANNSTGSCPEIYPSDIAALELSLLSLDVDTKPEIVEEDFSESPSDLLLETAMVDNESCISPSPSATTPVRRRRGSASVVTKSWPKRARLSTRRQPARDEYPSEELYLEAWNKWRIERDNNNESVKKSRQRAKQMRQLEAQKERRERLEARTPQEQVKDMEKEIMLLIKAFQTRHLLTRTEEAELREMIGHYTGVAPEEDVVDLS